MKLLGTIVNWKTPEMTVEAARSLARETEFLKDQVRIVIVDNASPDGSFEKMKKALDGAPWAGRVELVESGKNGGFGYGNNFGIRMGLDSDDAPEYFYLLNSDAFPDPGAVSTLVDFMDSRPDVGIAGSYIHGTDGRPHKTAFRFPSVASELETQLKLGLVTKLLSDYVVPLPLPTETTKVDWLAGCSMMIRKKVIDEIGLFDETFFLYFEETDLCRRAALAGWPTYYVPSSSVAHVGSASTGMQDATRRTPGYWFDSRRHYFKKNHGEQYLWVANAAWIVGHTIWKVRKKVQRKDTQEPPKMFSDFLRHTFLDGDR